jgi:NhaP-type Na+/H+ or K+/H+ antiporter
MAWFGPKGVATMTFSLLVLADGFPRIFDLAALCVFASILAHGLTDTPGSNWVAARAAARTGVQTAGSPGAAADAP